MEKLPLITVVIPVLNGEAYIAQCIESLLFQSFKELEVIVVDNGSTDRTAEIIQKYPTVKFIHHPIGGISGARNRGIELAQGEYIHFMDADDLITLDYYEKMLPPIVSTEADMACSSFIFERYPTQSQKVEHILLLSTIEDKILHTNVASYPACWRYLYKSSFIKGERLFFEENRFAEDKIFTIQAVHLAKKIVMVPEATYIYKHRVHSVTTSKKTKTIKKRHEDRKYANKFCENYAKRHHFSLDKSLDAHKWQYKVIGIPFITRKVYYSGKSKWYFLGIPIFQKKDIGK